jgi:hypothetical protein
MSQSLHTVMIPIDWIYIALIYIRLGGTATAHDANLALDLATLIQRAS